MKLEHQVCTLEQAKEFDKLGLKLESYFVWLEISKEKKEWILTTNLTYVKSEDFCEYSAYSCAELWGLFKTVLDHESTHTSTYACLHECATAIYKSKIPDAHFLADKIIEALKIKMIKPEDLSL